MSSRTGSYGPRGSAARSLARRGAAALLTAVVACGDAAAPELPAHVGPAHVSPARVALSATSSGAARHALAELRTAVKRYRDLDRAIADGWSTLATGCMSEPPRGAMGFHYADLSRFDATLDHRRPELLMYAPDEHGRLELVGVEFAVPLAAWTAPEPPSLFGQPFHVNEQFGLWVLHAWVVRPNPSGMFADWNPKVTCPTPAP